MRILGIDLGDARTGLALSDPTGFLAQGLCVINEWNKEKLLCKIDEYIKSYSVEKIVLGYPKNMNNTVGERGKMAEEFATKLKNLTNLEVILWDERRTTCMAHQILSENNKKGKSKKAIIDAVAATIILQGYLDSIKK